MKLKFIIDIYGGPAQTPPMSYCQRLTPILFLLSLSVGCGEDLIDQGKSASSTSGGSTAAPGAQGNTQPAVESPDPKVKHERDGDGYKSKLDATDRASWVYLDLDERAYPAADASEAGAWDLAFRRVNIRVNGGKSGSGNVGGKLVEGADAFDKMNQSPEGDFGSDKEVPIDPNTDPFGEAGLVFGFWYDYAPEGHVVTPKARTYVIQSNQGKVFKLQILDYYNEAKTSAHYTVRWAPLPPQNRFYNYAMRELPLNYTAQGARILAVIPHEELGA